MENEPTHGDLARQNTSQHDALNLRISAVEVKITEIHGDVRVVSARLETLIRSADKEEARVIELEKMMEARKTMPDRMAKVESQLTEIAGERGFISGLMRSPVMGWILVAIAIIGAIAYEGSGAHIIR